MRSCATSLSVADETALVKVDQPVKLTRKPRSARGIAKLQAKVHAEYFPDIFKEFYVQLEKRVKTGDMDALEMVAKIAKLTEKNGGVNVNVIQQNNTANVNVGRDRRFESIVRKLDQRDHEQSRPISDVQDAEFEDIGR